MKMLAFLRQNDLDQVQGSFSARVGAPSRTVYVLLYNKKF